MTGSLRAFLIGFFLLVIFGVPLTQAIVEMANGERVQALDIVRRKPTSANLRAYEEDLRSASVFARRLRPWLLFAWFAAFRNPGEKALVGRDDWFFYKPDVRYLVESSEQARQDAFEAIIAFRDQLAARGIRLLVMPVPGKPSIYPDRLTARANPTSGLSETRQLLAALRSAGVETADLFTSFANWREQTHQAEPWYLARDTHWTGHAAEMAASVVAAKLLQLGWVTSGSTDYRVQSIIAQRSGDVLHMMSVPRLERWFGPEPVRCEQVFRADTREFYKDDPHSPVLILGDSFLRIYEFDAPKSAGFIAHLARRLRMPVASVVSDGGASTIVRRQLSQKRDLLTGKKVVIWEFVERDLRFGTDGWEHVPLPGDPDRRADMQRPSRTRM